MTPFQAMYSINIHYTINLNLDSQILTPAIIKEYADNLAECHGHEGTNYVTRPWASDAVSWQHFMFEYWHSPRGEWWLIDFCDIIDTRPGARVGIAL